MAKKKSGQCGQRTCWNCRMRAYVQWYADEGWLCFEDVKWVWRAPRRVGEEPEVNPHTIKNCKHFRVIL